MATTNRNILQTLQYLILGEKSPLWSQFNHHKTIPTSICLSPVLTHPLQVEAIHHCHLCPQKCLSRDDLSGHLALEHQDLPHTPCPLCGETFPLHQLLALHLYQGHGRVLRVTAGQGAEFLLRENDSPAEGSAPPTTTKYTFVEPYHMKTAMVEDFEFNTTEVMTDVDDSGALSSTEIFFQMDENIEAEEEPISSAGLTQMSLPQGTTLIKATEEEILLEVEESTSQCHGGQNKSPDVHDIEVQLEALNAKTSKGSQNFVIYLGESIGSAKFGKTEPVATKHFPTKRRRTSVGDHRYPCTWTGCDKTFVAKHSVNMHVRNVHVSESVECGQCGKSYSNEENLKVHVRTVHSAVSTPCTWPGCRRVLSSERQMQSHYLKHSEKPKKCPSKDCNSVLKNSSVLRMHMKKMHSSLPEIMPNTRSPLPEPVIAPPTITTYKLK